MPSIDVAMARSLRGGVWGSITESLNRSMAPRGLGDKAGEAAHALSSWDNCMQVTYCKYVSLHLGSQIHLVTVVETFQSPC